MPFGVRKKTPGGDIYACPACKYVTADRKEYIKHLKTKHGLEIKPSDDKL